MFISDFDKFRLFARARSAVQTPCRELNIILTRATPRDRPSVRPSPVRREHEFGYFFIGKPAIFKRNSILSTRRNGPSSFHRVIDKLYSICVYTRAQRIIYTRGILTRTPSTIKVFDSYNFRRLTLQIII